MINYWIKKYIDKKNLIIYNLKHKGKHIKYIKNIGISA